MSFAPESGSSGGFLGGLSSLLGAVNPVLAGVGTAIDSIGPIASLFKPNDDKRSAASLQQIIEKNAIEIQNLVEAGKLAPEAAIAQLQQLQQQAAGIRGTPELQQAGIRASLIVGNALSTIKTKFISGLSGDFMDSTGSRFNLTGSPTEQKARLGTGLRNYALDTNLGAQLKGTPVGNAMDTLSKPATDPTARFKEISPLAQDFQPVDTGRLKRPLQKLVY